MILRGHVTRGGSAGPSRNVANLAETFKNAEIQDPSGSLIFTSEQGRTKHIEPGSVSAPPRAGSACELLENMNTECECRPRL